MLSAPGLSYKPMQVFQSATSVYADVDTRIIAKMKNMSNPIEKIKKLLLQFRIYGAILSAKEKPLYSNTSEKQNRKELIPCPSR